MTREETWQRLVEFKVVEGEMPYGIFKLSEVDLSEADLRGANLWGADLWGADLSEVDLSEADLRGANLSGAYLSGANLSEADLWGAELSGANLTGADLRGADLSGAYLTGADLSRAYLTGADLSEAYLSEADLSEAELSEADLWGANLTGADLSGANLTGTIGLVKMIGVIHGNYYYKRFDEGLVNNDYQFHVGINVLPDGEVFASDERILCSCPGFHFASRSWCEVNFPERPLEALIRIPERAQINEPWATNGKASADMIEIIKIWDIKTGEDVTEKYKAESI